MINTKKRYFKTGFLLLFILGSFLFLWTGAKERVLANDTVKNKLTPIIFIEKEELTAETLNFYKENKIETVFIKQSSLIKPLRDFSITPILTYEITYEKDDFKVYKEKNTENERYIQLQEVFSDIKTVLTEDADAEVAVDLSSSVYSDEEISDLFEILQDFSGLDRIYLILNEENYSLSLGENNILGIVVKITKKVQRISPKKDFTFYIDRWMEFSEKNVVEILPLISFNIEDGELTDEDDILAKGFYLKNKFLEGRNNRVIIGELSTKDSQRIFTDKFSVWLEKSIESTENIDMSFSTSLNIARPEKNISVSSATYNIFGTSSPSSAVYCNGEAVSNKGEGGTFSQLVKLVAGDNVFRFTQGAEEKSVVITRLVPKETDGKITVITKSSMAPNIDDYAYSGGEYDLMCIAPSSGVVKASIGEYSAMLEQQASTKSGGTPAVYRGKLKIGEDFNPTEIKNIGKITYTLTYNGVSSSYESESDLFIGGSQTKIGARSLRNMVNMYSDIKDVEEYKYSSTLDFGQWDYIIGAEDNYFQLSMGDYVKKSDIELIDVNKLDSGSLKNIEYNLNDENELITFIGIKNCVNKIEILEDSQVNVTFYGAGVDNVNMANFQKVLDLYIKKSEIFSGGTLKTDSEKDSITIELVCKNKEGLWGYFTEDSKITTEENSMTVYFKKNPYQIGIKPLDGKVIIIDPGHGGHDPGALGTAYNYGPKEKDLTLKTSLYTKQYLEEMGATVFMIRDNDTFLTIYERAVLNEKIKPDLFVAVHINSVDVSSDGLSRGTEIYYHNENGKNLANNILSSIESSIGRKNRGAKTGAYVVARPTTSPSVLCELGFMSNPNEYEEMINEVIMEKTAEAVAEGIKKTFIQGEYH